MKKLVIIDDSPTILSILQTIFKSEGYEVTVAANGTDGVAAVLSNHPDIALVDIMLPDMDGFEVCEQVRLKEFEKMPRLVIMTGSLAALDPDKVAKVEADDYCIKSEDLDSVIKTVNEVAATL